MRVDAFRAFLGSRLSPDSVRSYICDIGTVERLLDIDVDHIGLDDRVIANLRDSLGRAAMPKARVGNCASALQQYRQFLPQLFPTKQPAPLQTSRSTLVATASVPELMRLYADVLEELRDRKVIRTANGPVGDYAELLFARAFELTLAASSASGFDAFDASETRYQIKGRRVTSGPGGRQLGALRRLDQGNFDVLAAVLFDRNMQVLRAALIPNKIVVERAKRVEHTNSWRFMLSDAVWNLPTVRDATDALREAADML